MQRPAIGKTVLVPMDPAVNNGVDVAPALITRVWSEVPDSQGAYMVNIRAFRDSSEIVESRTSIRLAETHDAARALGGFRVAWWPPRG